MELLQKTKTFKNQFGKDVNYNVYYVVVYGREVELKPYRESDINLLKVGFENGQ